MPHVHTFTDLSGVQRVTDVATDCDYRNSQACAAADMRARWLPSPSSRAHAKALIAAEPAATMAIIPMIQPGKDCGFWTTGQDVRTIPGVVFLTANTDTPAGPVLGYSRARRYADLIAADELARVWAERRDAEPSKLHAPGTTAYAIIDADGEAHVFEGF